jgi:hypothetical protein
MSSRGQLSRDVKQMSIERDAKRKRCKQKTFSRHCCSDRHFVGTCLCPSGLMKPPPPSFPVNLYNCYNVSNIIYIYIQVPGQAGGGCFTKINDL